MEFSVNGYKFDKGPKFKLEIIFIIIALIFAAFFLHGCISAAKKIEKAKQLVLTDSAAFRQIGVKFVQINPCTNLITYKNDTTYRHDTVITTVHHTDTLHHVDTVLTTKFIYNYRTIHDTATIIDGQKVSLLQQSLAEKNIEIAGASQQIKDAQDAVNKSNSRANKFLGILILIGVIVAGVSLWKVFRFFNPASAASGSILKKILPVLMILLSGCSFGQVVNGWYKANESIKLRVWFGLQNYPCCIYTEPGEYFKCQYVDSNYVYLKTINVYPLHPDIGNIVYYTYDFIIPIKEFNTPKIQRVSFIEANGFTNQ